MPKKPFITFLNKQSFAEQAYIHIKKMILTGVLKGGEKISEDMIASQLSVSRTPIREALQQLSQYGLVRLELHRSAVVVDFDATDMVHISAIRRELELLVCHTLAERSFVESDLVALRQLSENCIDQLGKGNRYEALEYDSLFHLELAKLSGNLHLHELMELFDAKIQLLRLQQKESDEGLMPYLMHHREVIAALLEGHPGDLPAIMEKHLSHHEHAV